MNICISGPLQTHVFLFVDRGLIHHRLRGMIHEHRGLIHEHRALFAAMDCLWVWQRWIVCGCGSDQEQHFTLQSEVWTDYVGHCRVLGRGCL